VQLKSAATGDVHARARRQVLAMSLVALGQGVPFFLAGDDLLRSKDMGGNSFDPGDWFSKLDFSYPSSNWGTGLPIASQNQGNWPLMQPLLANAALTPQPSDIAHSATLIANCCKFAARPICSTCRPRQRCKPTCIS
jgi:pullulanase